MGYFVGCFNYDYIAIAQGNVAFGIKEYHLNTNNDEIFTFSEYQVQKK